MTTHPQDLPPLASAPVGPAGRPGAPTLPDAPGTSSPSPAYPRAGEGGRAATWTITLPASMELLNANEIGRAHV